MGMQQDVRWLADQVVPRVVGIQAAGEWPIQSHILVQAQAVQAVEITILSLVLAVGVVVLVEEEAVVEGAVLVVAAAAVAVVAVDQDVVVATSQI